MRRKWFCYTFFAQQPGMRNCKKLWGLILLAIIPLERSAAAPVQTIRVGFFPNITHAQALYGKATLEFEKKTGVPIKWTSFNAGPAAIESIFANAVDLTFVGPGPSINGFIKSHGEKFVIIAGGASGG